jgi:hypothetical protein
MKQNRVSQVNLLHSACWDEHLITDSRDIDHEVARAYALDKASQGCNHNRRLTNAHDF